MPRPRINNPLLYELYQVLNDGDYSDSDIRQIIDSLQTDSGIETSYSDGTLTVSSKKQTVIKSLDDLIAHCDIDLDKWKIKRHIVNSWPTTAKDNEGKLIQKTNFQVKAWLEPRTEQTNFQAQIDTFIDDIKSFSPKPITAPTYIADRNYLSEISIFDLHFGKLAWAAETGSNYDSSIAQDRSNKAFNFLLEKSKRKPIDHFLMVVGNDELHIDSMREETTAGTPQHTDSRWQNMVSKVMETRINQIETAKQIAPVHVLTVPGNHDEMMAQMFGRELKAYFHRDSNVKVDASPTLTKNHCWGENLLMFNHGKDIKISSLPNQMAIQKPMLYGQTSRREVHIGHFHKRARMFQVEDETGGVQVRVIPSLAGADYWHTKKGFLGNLEAAQCFIYEKDNGIEDICQYTEPTEHRVRQAV